MKKHLFLFLLPSLLLLLCACGRGEDPVSSEPTAAPTATDAATTEPEPAAPVAFRLKELPDIGTYQPKKAACFYDAPLREFRASDDYGTLFPYCLGRHAAEDGSLGRYGFMTADGKIVTGPIYESIYGADFGGKTVYFATGKVLDQRPVKIPSWEEDREKAANAYQTATEYYYRHESCQLITADGSRCLSQPTEWRWFTDENTGLTLFWTSQYEATGEPETYRCVSFPLYDADLNLAADLAPYLQEYDDVDVLAIEKDRLVIRARRYEEPDDTSDTDLLFFRNGRLDHTLALGGEFPYRAAGGLILCEKRLIDEYGNTVYPLNESYSNAQYDPHGGWYVCDAEQGKLVRIDRKGRVLAATKIQPSTDFFSVTLYDSGSKTYVVIPHDRNNEDTDGFVVLDADLREACTIGGDGTDKTDFCGTYGDGPGVFLTAKDGKTEIRDITGRVLADLPFAYDGYNLHYGDGDKQQVFLYREQTQCAVFSAADRSVVSFPFHGETVSYPDYFSQKLLAYMENVKSGDIDGESDWRYVIWDMTTGKRLLENLSSFSTVTVNGKICFNYLKNDVSYVCDEDLNVIAAIYDDLFV